MDQIISDFLNKNLKKIKTLYDPRALWFFGSRVSGKAKTDSDIDLLIVSEKFKNIKFIFRMGDFLKKIDYSKHIDAICYTPEEFEKKQNEIGLVSDILEKGNRVI